MGTVGFSAVQVLLSFDDTPYVMGQLVVQIHFQFTSDVGSVVGEAISRATLEAFGKNWDKF